MITYKAKTASGEIINSALTPFAFPAGEAHIKREERRALEPVEIAVLQPSANSIHDDLFHLAMWCDYIKRQNHAEGDETRTVLLLPYIPGARADRGTPFGLDVYMNFLHTIRVDQYIVFDPHSSVSEQMLGASYHRAITTVRTPADILRPSQFMNEYSGIIAPDKGAVGRAGAVANKFGLPLYTATKSRNPETGKLTFGALDTLPEEGNFLIVDDICDGGGTFLALAEAADISPLRLDLWVSHGVFSGKALETLPLRFGRIYTTNSYTPSRPLHPAFVRHDVIRQMLEEINV